MINAMVTLVGNLGQEPDAKYTPKGQMVVNASLAVNVGSGETKTTDWYKLVAWGGTAEMFKKLTQKGTTVLISGRQRIKITEDKGVKYTNVEVTIQDFNVIKGGAEKHEADESEPGFMQD